MSRPNWTSCSAGGPHAPTSLTRLNENEVGNAELFKFNQTDHTAQSEAITNFISHVNTVLNLKYGKAIPLQAWTVPEGSRRLRLPDFKTVGT